jgi:hypothetical protein
MRRGGREVRNSEKLRLTEGKRSRRSRMLMLSIAASFVSLLDTISSRVVFSVASNARVDIRRSSWIVLTYEAQCRFESELAFILAG